MAGYVTQYDINNFTFLTVKGAGHMVESKLFLPAVILFLSYTQVPQFKPKQAYAMFERFINQQPF